MNILWQDVSQDFTRVAFLALHSFYKFLILGSALILYEREILDPEFCFGG